MGLKYERVLNNKSNVAKKPISCAIFLACNGPPLLDLIN